MLLLTVFKFEKVLKSSQTSLGFVTGMWQTQAISKERCVANLNWRLNQFTDGKISCDTSKYYKFVPQEFKFTRIG